MRRVVLLRSVQKLLRDDEHVVEAAYLWSRHRLLLPFALGAFVLVAVVAALVGFGGWAAPVGLGLAGAAVAAMATTEYRVLAQTDRGFMLCRGSRVRQAATGLIERLPDDLELSLVGNQMVLTEWTVGDRRFSAPKASEQALVRMARPGA